MACLLQVTDLRSVATLLAPSGTSQISSNRRGYPQYNFRTCIWGLRAESASTGVAPLDFEASEYDLGATSVRLIRVGNVIQIVFSKKLAAEFYYADASARFKSEAEGLKRR